MNPGEKRKWLRGNSGKRVSLRDMFIAWWPVFVVVAAGFAVAYQFVRPAPPDSVVISAGAEEGAYFAYAERYREFFARNDVVLEIRSSSGSVENLARLKDEDSDVDIAFMQGGIGSTSEAPDLESIGSMYYEPVWVFHRLEGVTDRLTQIKSSRVAIGPEGSGTRKLASALWSANGIAPPRGKLSELSGNAAAKALQQGEIDVAVFVGSPEVAAIRTLMRDRKVRLMSFANSEAYNRHFPYLSTVVLPRGGIDLRRNIPPQDVHLLATTANLVVRDNLHPAIVDLLAGAAAEIHGTAGFFHRQGQFPSTKESDFPISSEAERYYKSGPSFLQRFLPFWAAVFVDRMIVFLVPIIALLIPLIRILPMLYDWRVNSRIYRYYGQLRFLEDEVSSSPPDGKSADYLQRLDGIESQINRLSVPLAFNHQVYTLREHIDLVRARIGARAGVK